MLRTIAAGLLVIGLSGCGGDKPIPPEKSVGVTGTVTMDGKPLEKATVRFVPQAESGQGFGGSGLTDSAGKYELRSMAAEEEAVIGTPPGKYKVVISKMVKPDGTVADMMEPPMMSAARETIPLKYSDYSSTMLKEDVSSTGGTYNFDLKSK